MYGGVVEKRPTDWDGSPKEGNYIILDEFMADLSRLSAAKKITIRMNSLGGEVVAALPIYNRLRELKATVEVIVDGVAMSAASFIMCAADTVKVNTASLIMIHKASDLLFGRYNADEMRDCANFLDTVDKALVAAYARKTGKSEGKLLSMMAAETYMTGQEAVDKGFADELIDEAPSQISASANGRTLLVNGKPRRLAFPMFGLPDTIPTVIAEAGTPVPDLIQTQQPVVSGGKKGGTLMAKNLEELRAENPELAAALIAEANAATAPAVTSALEAERKRIREIDALASLYDDVFFI